MDSSRRPMQHGEELPILIPSDDGVDAVDHNGMDGAKSDIGGVASFACGTVVRQRNTTTIVTGL